MKTKIIGYLFLIVTLASCLSKKATELPLDPTVYKAEIEQWHQQRIEDLKGHNGWLNLAGLFWLKEGVNTFGSEEGNDIVFPKDKIAAKAGLLLLQNNTVTMTSLPGVEIMSNDSPIKTGIIFYPDSIRQPKLTYGSLQWFIIKRDDKFGVRLRDLKSTAVDEFHGIERYEVDPAFRTEAILERPAAPKKIDITNILGQTTAQDSPGTLVFSIQGKEYRLDALEEGEELFIIFSDDTNEKETYPSGRYVYAKKPGEDGKTILDFNRAFNPPCAFTPFATCSLPPPQNQLPIAVVAGEKNYKGYAH